MLGLLAPLVVQAAVYYGVYVGVVRTKRRLHQRAVTSGRASIVNLAMRVSQSSSRWSVVSSRFLQDQDQDQDLIMAGFCWWEVWGVGPLLPPPLKSS